MFHVKVCNILLPPFQKDPLSRKKIVSKGYIFDLFNVLFNEKL